MATATADVVGDTLTARGVDGNTVLVFERDPGYGFVGKNMSAR